MPKDDSSSFLPLYLETARERLKTISGSLLELEKNPLAAGEIENIFIAAHTLKSESAMMGFSSTAHLSHVIEDVMSAVKEGSVKISGGLVDHLLNALDAISRSLDQIERGGKEAELASVARKLKVMTGVKTAGVGKSPRARKPVSLEAAEHEDQVKTVTVPIERLDRMMNLVEEAAISRARLDELSKEILSADLRQNVKEFDRLINELEYEIMQARLVPLEFIFNRIPRVVRDLARDEKKEIEIKVEGGDVSLDKSVIDHLLEPLIHIIRNAVSHGIKDKGEIGVKASRERDRVLIRVSDTGRGIDVPALKRKAVKEGVLDASAARGVKDEEAFNLIFLGVSTSPEVTSVAGRGIGMKAVKAAIEALSGKIAVESSGQGGTTFLITLPLTLAIIKVMLVSVEQNVYALPSSLIEKSIQIKSGDKLPGGVPLISMRELFGGKNPPAPKRKIVLVNTERSRAGIVVDDIIRDDEIIVKPLPPILSGIKFFQATTILSDGKAALLLDIPEILTEAKRV